MSPILTPIPTSVYRYYDSDDLLIYVGITSRGIARNREHNTSKEWWPHVARQEVEHFDTRELAADRERSLIQAFRPPFNKQHNPQSTELQAAYLAYRGATGEPSSGRSLFNSLSRQVPLVFVDQPSKRHIIMRSQPQHSPLACSIVHQPGVKVYGGNGVGFVREVERRGMFALFHLKVESKEPLSGAAAFVKFLDQKTETFVLRNVHMHRRAD